MEKALNNIWGDLKKSVSIENLEFLKKCFRAYSSEAHTSNMMRDFEILKRFSPPSQRVLDFGCGIGLQSFLLAQLGYDVYALETVEDKSLDDFLKGKAESYKISREQSMENVWRIIKGKQNVQFQFYDGKNIPFSDGYFDIIFTYAVLEHIPPDEIIDILNEIRRVLKSGGLFYIYQLPRRSSYTEFIARKLGIESHPFLWHLNTITQLLKTRDLLVIFSEKVDMLFNHPYKIVNPLFSIFQPINKFLIHTPLSYFAHHLTVVSKRI